VWALVAVPQRALPTHSLIRSDIASGHANDLGRIGGFAGGEIVIAEGSLWAAEGAGGDKVHRIDPANGKTVATVQVNRNPTGLVHGAGSIWVTAAERSSVLGVQGLAVYRIDPAENRIVGSVPVPLPDSPAEGIPWAMLAFARGAVWTGDSRTGAIARIDPAAGRVVATIERPRTEASAKRYGFTLHSAGDRLVLVRRGFRIERGVQSAPVTDVTVWEIDTEANRIAGEPAQVARDGVVLCYVDGVAWLGSTRVDRLTRVDPITLQPLGPALSVGHPVYVIAGRGGSLLAIGGAGRTAGEDRPISWITRVVP
jgi:sugar lactone lactonase YvrE